MDICGVLSAEQSKANTTSIVDYIGSDKERFAELMDIFLEGEYRLTQRAAWPISVCAETRPDLIGPYLNKLVDLLPRRDIHNAVKRNIVRLLQFIEIPKKIQGKVFSHCIDLINDPNEAIAVRSFALTVAGNVANGNADLLNELHLVAEGSLGNATASFRVRFNRLFN